MKVKVGDLVIIRPSGIFISEWMTKAQKNNTPLLVVGINSSHSGSVQIKVVLKVKLCGPFITV
mgnify:CR=1 FL=1